jgi:hypothetical protein
MKGVEIMNILVPLKKSVKSVKEYIIDILYWEKTYKIKMGIRNLWRWKGIIWSDRNWDDTFLFRIMRHKLNLMYKDMNKYSHHLYVDDYLKTINKCILILDRLIDQEYSDNALYFHDKKWGEIKINTIPYNDEYVKLDVYRPIARQKELEEQEIKEFQKWMKHSNYMEKQDIEFLFNTMKKHIRNWWY